MLRRRLQERVADQWTDAELNELLNLGLLEIQKSVLQVDPLAIIWIDVDDIVAGQEFYEVPPGMWYEFEVGVKTSASDADFTILDPCSYHTRRSLSSGAGRYSRLGKYISIRPIPTGSVVDGLQVRYVPSLSMSNDSDVPDLNLGLHLGIVLWAQILALGESLEDSGPTQATLKGLIEQIPLFYRNTTQPMYLQPNITKGY